jgi:hypothetical protein
MTYEEIEELLSKYHWVLECKSPLEIRSKDGEHFAKNYAAEVVIEYLALLDASNNEGEKEATIERFSIEKYEQPNSDKA